MSAIRSRWWSPTRSIWRATPPSASRSITRRGPRWYRRARRSSPARRSSTTIARTTRPISTRPATRPRPMPRSPTPRTSSSSAWSSTASPPITLEPRGVTGEYDRRHRPLHAALRLPAAVAVPQRHRRNHDEDSGGGAPADHRRHRRLLRPARLGLSGNHLDAVGGAPRRPAGEMDLHPQRGAYQRRRRPRQHRRCGAGARPGRQVPRRAHPQLRQSRRLRVVSRRDAAGGQHRHGRAASTRRRRCMSPFPAC